MTTTHVKNFRTRVLTELNLLTSRQNVSVSLYTYTWFKTLRLYIYTYMLIYVYIYITAYGLPIVIQCTWRNPCIPQDVYPVFWDLCLCLGVDSILSRCDGKTDLSKDAKIRGMRAEQQPTERRPQCTPPPPKCPKPGTINLLYCSALQT